MERDYQIEATELKDEELEAVNGGAYRFVRANAYGLGSGNTQLWVVTATDGRG